MINYYKLLRLISLQIIALPFLVTSFVMGQVIEFNTVGNRTYTVPDNVCSITVEVVGAGAGGGYSDSRGQTTGGGGGGAYAKRTIQVTPGQVINYSIGAGGSGASGLSNGGSSWFLNTTTVFAEGGKGAANNTTSGGLGGSVANSIGDVVFAGGKGGNGSGNGDCHASGGGASAAGPAVMGNDGRDGIYGNPSWGCQGKTGGPGGPAVAGINGGRGGEGATNNIGGQGGQGGDGEGYGAGGGGGKRGSALIFEGGAKRGGNGTSGFIRIELNFSTTSDISGLTSICSGSSTTLTGAGVGTYLWSTGETTDEITVDPTVTTTYTLTVTSAEGCPAVNSLTVNVTPAILAPVSINGIGEYCIGNKVTLTQVGGNAGASYEWYSGACQGTVLGTGNSITIAPLTTTTVFVRALGNAVCPASPCVNGSIIVNSAGNQLSNDRDVAVCPVKENNWVHFYKNGRLLASVNSLGQNLGRVTATSYVDPTNQLIPACDNPDSENDKTSILNRHWVLTPQFQPTLPVLVRLPFYEAELESLSGASIVNANPNDNVYLISDVVLSKYSGPNNVNESALDNCVSEGGNGNTTIFTQTTSGNTNAYSTIENGKYIDFTVPNFSEFWLHGQSAVSPLSINIADFSVDCETVSNRVSLKVQMAKNIEELYVDASIDGNVWRRVAVVKEYVFNNNTKEIIIVDTQKEKDTKYYRLTAKNYEGVQEVLRTIVSNCSKDEIEFDIYPNPATSEVNISWNGQFKEAKVSLISFDGKIVFTQMIDKNEKIYVDKVASGSYMLQLKSTNGSIAYKKLVIL